MDDLGHQVLKFSLHLGKIDIMVFFYMSIFFHDIIKSYSVLSNLDRNIEAHKHCLLPYEIHAICSILEQHKYIFETLKIFNYINVTYEQKILS